MRNKKNKTGLTHTVRSSLKANREDIMKANRKKSGKNAWRSGVTLERKIEALAQYHQDDEPLELELIRNHDAMAKAKGKGGGITAFTTGISSCDFSFWTSNNFGWVMGGMLEAKNRQSNRINKSALSHHQKDQLIRMEKLGHLGLVLVGLVEDNLGVDVENYFIVPISHWFCGHKQSHNSDDLRALGYQCNIIKIFNDDGHEIEVPDILSVLKKIDADGKYNDVPKEYRNINDNKKIKGKKIWSTIDKELEDIIDFDYDVDAD